MAQFNKLGEAGARLTENILADPHLISLWVNNEKSGATLYDRSTKNRVNLTITGSPIFGKKMATPSSAGQFTAANSEYLSIADNASLSMAAEVSFAVATWVYLDSKPANGTILAKWNTTGNQREYNLRFESGADRFLFYVSNDGTAVVSVTASTFGSPSTAVWYFIVAWHDAVANTINIQVNNGTADSAAHTTGVFNGTSNFLLGARDTPTDFHNGRTGSTQLWKRILTAAEKTWLYNNRMGRAYAESVGTTLRDGLISWWDLTEASGNRADSHGSNTLTDNATVTSNPGVIRSSRAVSWGLEWSGSGQYADGGAASAFDFEWSNPFSLLAIVTADWLTTDSNDILSKFNVTSLLGWRWLLTTSGAPELYLRASNLVAVQVTANAALTRLNTYMLGASYSGNGLASGVTLYKDGATDADTDTTDNLAFGTIKNTKPVQLAASDSARLFRGDIGLVAAFSAAKSAENFRRWAYLARFL